MAGIGPGWLTGLCDAPTGFSVCMIMVCMFQILRLSSFRKDVDQN